VTAQVRIGGTDDPGNSAVLDLNPTNNKVDGTKGLVLPRVALDSLGDNTTLGAHVQGMTVYNTSDVGEIHPGIYTNTGSRWERVSNGAALSTVPYNGTTMTSITRIPRNAYLKWADMNITIEGGAGVRVEGAMGMSADMYCWANNPWIIIVAANDQFTAYNYGNAARLLYLVQCF
jgi:hypothetical protein